MGQPLHTLLPYFQQLREQFRLRPPASAKTVVYLCLSSPVELLDAAGIIAIRLMPGSSKAELRGGRFLSSDSCSFCKAVLGGLDRGDVKPDAVLGSTTCDQMRRNLEIIQRDLNLRTFIFNAPRTAENPISREFAREELRRLSDELAAWAGVEITSDNLHRSIRRRQKIRERLTMIVGAHSPPRRTPLQPPRLSGSEFFALMQLYQTTSLDFFEEHLPEIEARITQRGSPCQHDPICLALLGSCIGEGDDQIIKLIEEGGRAAVVYDSICTGRRALREFSGVGAHSSAPVSAPDPFEILTSLYHDQILCPHRLPNDRLFDVVAEEIRTLDVQGVVYKTLKFCHPWGFEARRFKDFLGLPFLHLDHDLSESAIGQMRTRIAAFIEQLTMAQNK